MKKERFLIVDLKLDEIKLREEIFNKPILYKYFEIQKIHYDIMVWINPKIFSQCLGNLLC